MLLIANGAEIDALDYFGRTPLHYVAGATLTPQSLGLCLSHNTSTWYSTPCRQECGHAAWQLDPLWSGGNNCIAHLLIVGAIQYGVRIGALETSRHMYSCSCRSCGKTKGSRVVPCCMCRPHSWKTRLNMVARVCGACHLSVIPMICWKRSGCMSVLTGISCCMMCNTITSKSLLYKAVSIIDKGCHELIRWQLLQNLRCGPPTRMHMCSWYYYDVVMYSKSRTHSQTYGMLR